MCSDASCDGRLATSWPSPPDAQAISNAAAKNGLAGTSCLWGPQPPRTGIVVAISSLETKAPGETGDETNNARRRRRWEAVETMIKSRKAIGKQALKFGMAGIAVPVPVRRGSQRR